MMQAIYPLFLHFVVGVTPGSSHQYGYLEVHPGIEVKITVARKTAIEYEDYGYEPNSRIKYHSSGTSPAATSVVQDVSLPHR